MTFHPKIIFSMTDPPDEYHEFFIYQPTLFFNGVSVEDTQIAKAKFDIDYYKNIGIRTEPNANVYIDTVIRYFKNDGYKFPAAEKKKDSYKRMIRGPR